MPARRLHIREIIEAFFALLAMHGGFLVMAVAAIAVGFIITDVVMPAAGVAISSLLVTIWGQFIVVERLLADRLPGGKASERRYGAIFVSSLLAGVAIILGLVLLIIPGIFLMAAWAVSTPFIVGRGMSGVDALDESWRVTAGSRLAIALVMLLGLVPLFGLFALVILGAEWVSEAGWSQSLHVNGVSLVEIVPGNIVAGVFSVVGWVFAVAVFRLLQPDETAYEEIFA